MKPVLVLVVNVTRGAILKEPEFFRREADHNHRGKKVNHYELRKERRNRLKRDGNGGAEKILSEAVAACGVAEGRSRELQGEKTHVSVLPPGKLSKVKQTAGH